MGYRSEVKIATTREGYERICKRVDEMGAGSKATQLIGAKITPDYREDFDDAVVFGWDWIKWYDGDYEEITNVCKALRELPVAGIPYQFCRVGESWDDIEFINCDEDGKLVVNIEPSVSVGIYYR